MDFCNTMEFPIAKLWNFNLQLSVFLFYNNHMEIITLVDKTDKQTSSRWIVNHRNIGEVYSYRVYYAEIDYRINNTQFSYLKDGINYFKIITVKEKKDSSWQIGEMSAAEASWKDE